MAKTTTASSCCLRKSVFCFCENLRFTSERRFGTWLAIATAWQRMGVLNGFWTMFGLREHGSRRKHDRTSLEAFFESPPSNRSRSCRNLTTENTRNCHFFRPHTYYHCCGTISHSARPNELRRSNDENGVSLLLFCRAILCIEGRNRKIRGGSDIVLT